MALGAVQVLAHGPQLQLTNESNKITTRALHLDEPYNSAMSDPTSVYVMPLAPISSFGGTAFWAQPSAEHPISGPGLAWCYGWTYTNSTTYTTSFPVGSNFVESLVGGLQKHNGSTFVAAPDGAQVQIFKTDTNFGISGTPSASVTLKSLVAPTSATFDDHTGVRFQLLGDGVVPSDAHAPALVEEGIYAIQLKLSLANQPQGSNIADSDPFHFVFFKGVEPGSALAAAQAAFPGASIQLVPEPALAGVLMVAAMTMRRDRRGGRRA
jgi:hypothetical protein